MLIYEQRYNLPTLTVNSLGCLGKAANEFVDRLTTSVVVVEENENLQRNNVVEEQLMQIVSRHGSDFPLSAAVSFGTGCTV